MKLELPCPQDFRLQDFVAYHRRFEGSPAEWVEACPTDHQSPGLSGGPVRILKGVCWGACPALLELHWPHPQLCKVTYNAPHQSREIRPSLSSDELAGRVRQMLGLTQQDCGFFQAHSRHPILGPLIRERPGLRPTGTGCPQEALVWAVVGQQVSLRVAQTMRRKLIELANCSLSEQILAKGPVTLAFPSLCKLGSLSVEQLRQASLSGAKAATIATLAKEEVRFPELGHPITSQQTQQLEARLLSIKGVGPWTVSYTLLRGLGWLDGSLHGDAAFRNRLGRLLNQQEKVTAEQAQDWLEQFRPWRALAAAHVWASL